MPALVAQDAVLLSGLVLGHDPPAILSRAAVVALAVGGDCESNCGVR